MIAILVTRCTVNCTETVTHFRQPHGEAEFWVLMILLYLILRLWWEYRKKPTDIVLKRRNRAKDWGDWHNKQGGNDD